MQVMDGGMFHNKNSIISQHYGLSSFLLEEDNNEKPDSTNSSSELHDGSQNSGSDYPTERADHAGLYDFAYDCCAECDESSTARDT